MFSLIEEYGRVSLTLHTFQVDESPLVEQLQLLQLRVVGCLWQHEWTHYSLASRGTERPVGAMEREREREREKYRKHESSKP